MGSSQTSLFKERKDNAPAGNRFWMRLSKGVPGPAGSIEPKDAGEARKEACRELFFYGSLHTQQTCLVK